MLYLLVLESKSMKTILDLFKNFLNFVKSLRCIFPFNIFIKKDKRSINLPSNVIEIMNFEDDAKYWFLATIIQNSRDEKLKKYLTEYLINNIKPTCNFITDVHFLEDLNNLLDTLLTKVYRPWWLLFTFKLFYYSGSVRENILKTKLVLDELIARENTKRTMVLGVNHTTAVNIYDETLRVKYSNDNHEQKTISSALEVLQKETKDRSRKVIISGLIKYFKDIGHIDKIIPIGGLSYIIATYLADPNNAAKDTKIKVEEISKKILSLLAKYTVKSACALMVPSLGDLASAATHVLTSSAHSDPTHKDKIVTSAITGTVGAVAGGVIGGCLVPLYGLTSELNVEL